MCVLDRFSRGGWTAMALASTLTFGGCCSPRIVPDQLPTGRVGEPYEVQFDIECWGGTWWISGELPAGLSFNSEGLLSGTPRYPGIYFLTVNWEDVYEGEVIDSATSAYDLVILDKEQAIPR